MVYIPREGPVSWHRDDGSRISLTGLFRSAGEKELDQHRSKYCFGSCGCDSGFLGRIDAMSYVMLRREEKSLGSRLKGVFLGGK